MNPSISEKNAQTVSKWISMNLSKKTMLAAIGFVGLVIAFLFQNCQQTPVEFDDKPQIYEAPLAIFPKDFSIVATPEIPTFGAAVVLKPSFYQDPATSDKFQKIDWNTFEKKWRFKGVEIANQTDITLTIAPFQEKDSGSYQFSISKGGETLLSRAFNLGSINDKHTLPKSIAIVMSPTKQMLGNPVDLSIAPDNTKELDYFKYQWIKDNQPIGTVSQSPVLKILNFQESDKGQYTLRMSLPNDPDSSRLSEAFTLTNVDPTQSLPDSVVLESSPLTPTLNSNVTLQLRFPQDPHLKTPAIVEQYYSFEWTCPATRANLCSGNKTSQLNVTNVAVTDDKFQVRVCLKDSSNTPCSSSSRSIVSQELSLVSFGVLTVTKPSNGKIVSLEGAGAFGSRIKCGEESDLCTAIITSSSGIDLGVIPALYHKWTGWTNGCLPTQQNCTVKSTTTVAGGFAPINEALTVAVTDIDGNPVNPVTGTSAVIGNVGPINCSNISGSICSANINVGTAVSLTAAAGPGFTFEGWKDCPAIDTAHPNICSFDLPTNAISLQAQFSNIESSVSPPCARNADSASARLDILDLDCYDANARQALTIAQNDSQQLLFKRNFYGRLNISQTRINSIASLYFQKNLADILFVERKESMAILNFKNGGAVILNFNNVDIKWEKFKIKFQNTQEVTLEDILKNQVNGLVVYNYTSGSAIGTQGADILLGTINLLPIVTNASDKANIRVQGMAGNDTYVLPLSLEGSQNGILKIDDSEGKDIVHIMRNSTSNYEVNCVSNSSANDSTLQIKSGKIEYQVLSAQNKTYRLDNSSTDLTFDQLKQSTSFKISCTDTAKPPQTVTVATPTNGRVTGPGGLDCGPTGTNCVLNNVPQGSSLTLEAIPDEHYQVSWTGCTESQQGWGYKCTASVGAAPVTVTATFVKNIDSPNPLCFESLESQIMSSWPLAPIGYGVTCIAGSANGFMHKFDLTNLEPIHILVKTSFNGSVSYDARSSSANVYFYIQKNKSEIKYFEKDSGNRAIKFTFNDGAAIALLNLPTNLTNSIFLAFKDAPTDVSVSTLMGNYTSTNSSTEVFSYNYNPAGVVVSSVPYVNSSRPASRIAAGVSTILNPIFLKQVFSSQVQPTTIVQGTVGNNIYLVASDDPSSTSSTTYILDDAGTTDTIRILQRPSNTSGLTYSCLSDAGKDQLKIIDSKTNYLVIDAGHFSYKNGAGNAETWSLFKTNKSINCPAADCPEGQRKNASNACANFYVPSCTSGGKVWNFFTREWQCTGGTN